MNYLDFLKTKMLTANETGFDISDEELNPVLIPHQRDAVRWAVKGGCRALFESFGLGKTVQELEFCRITTERDGGKALIVLPLGVKQEFVRDAVHLLGLPGADGGPVGPGRPRPLSLREVRGLGDAADLGAL